MKNPIKVTDDEINFLGDDGNNTQEYILADYNDSVFLYFENCLGTETNNGAD